MATTRQKYRYPSRAAAEAALAEVQSANWLNSLALNCVLGDDAEFAGETAKIGRYSYAAALYRAAAGHGGIVVVSYRCDGQRPSTEAHYADTWCRTMANYPIAVGDDEMMALRGLACQVARAAAEIQRKAWAPDTLVA